MINKEEKLFSSSKERTKLALKDASNKLNDLIELKGYFTSEDVNNALADAFDICGDYIVRLIKNAFKTIKSDIPFVYSGEGDNVIANLVRHKRPFIFYDIERFGMILIISWKYEGLTGRSELLNDPTFNDLCDAARSILTEIKKYKGEN